MRVCGTTWEQAPQSRDDCSHAAGHGFFYYFFDIGRAVEACWTEDIVDHAPCGSKPTPGSIWDGGWKCIVDKKVCLT